MEPAQDLASFIDASPTPFHAVHNAAARLLDAGFELFEAARADQPGARFVVRDGALVAWVDGDAPLEPMRLVGAHTDSPNLRVRPRPDTGTAGFRQLAVEVYGGALLNSWLDRDLGLAGRVVLRGGRDGVETRLLRHTASGLSPDWVRHGDSLVFGKATESLPIVEKRRFLDSEE